MAQRFDNRPPPVPEIDRSQALWMAFLNVLNSLKVLETSSFAGMFKTSPGWPLFEGAVLILEAMVLPEEKDEEYHKDLTPGTTQQPIRGRHCGEYHSSGPSRNESWGRSYEYPCECQIVKIPEEIDAMDIWRALNKLISRKHLFKVRGLIGKL